MPRLCGLQGYGLWKRDESRHIPLADDLGKERMRTMTTRLSQNVVRWDQSSVDQHQLSWLHGR